jgi:hypothetical protein
VTEQTKFGKEGLPVAGGASQGDKTAPEFAVRHYSVKELVAMWKLSENTVRALFEHEPGVLCIEAAAAARKFSRRRYRTLRIPEPVAARVYARLSKTA